MLILFAQSKAFAAACRCLAQWQEIEGQAESGVAQGLGRQAEMSDPGVTLRYIV